MSTRRSESNCGQFNEHIHYWIKRANRCFVGDSVEAYIYLIKSGDYVKIGIAKDVLKRLAMMQVGNPHELSLIKLFASDAPVIDEECLHAEFERYRVRGEWFKIPQEHLDCLLALDTLADLRE